MCALDYWIGKVKEWERQRQFWLLNREFDFPEFEEERLNAPGRPREIIRNEGGRFTLSEARWGFERPPDKDWEGSERAYNARSETVDKLEIFQPSFRGRRCLLVGAAFCEYGDRIGGQLVRFTPTDEFPYAYAGLWQASRLKEGELVCTMLTTEPSQYVADYHSRMPVVLQEDQLETWLHPDSDLDDLKPLFVPNQDKPWRMELEVLEPRKSKYEKREEAGQEAFEF